MAYARFYQPHYDADPSPAFQDSDGSPVYEYYDQGLLCAIILRNDVVALNLYNDCPHTRVLWKAYEFDSSNPFHIAVRGDSFDVVRELIRIYLSDESLTEPLEDYLKRFHVSPVVEACATANQEMVLWLMNHNPPLGTLHDRDLQGRTALLVALEALKVAGNLMLQVKSKDSAAISRKRELQRCERFEPFVHWLLDMGCSVEANVVEKQYEQEQQDEAEKFPVLRETVLGEAVSHASYELVSRLIAKGANVHAHQG